MPTQNDNPTVTPDELTQQYTRLAWLLKQAEKADQEARWAVYDYDTAYEPVLEKFQEEHPDLVNAKNSALDRKSAAHDQVIVAREALKGSLALYWLDNREDEKPLDGLGKRDSVKVMVRPGQDALLHMQLREHAPWLLKVDEKALEQFVKDNAVVTADGHAALPSPLANYLNALVPVVQREATISDKTLLKFAPDVDPDAITAAEQDDAHEAGILERLADATDDVMTISDAAAEAAFFDPDDDPWAAEHEYRSQQVADPGDIPF